MVGNVFTGTVVPGQVGPSAWKPTLADSFCTVRLKDLSAVQPPLFAPCAYIVKGYCRRRCRPRY